MKVRTVGMLGLALAASLGLLGGQSARAQAQAQPPAPEEDLGPIPRPITLFLLDKPTVTVSFQGDYGPVRATGVLDKAPEETLRVRSIQGLPREARWTEIRDLSVVQFPREGMPAGTFQVSLVSDPVSVTQISAGGAGIRDYSTDAGGWGAARLPDGNLTLTGKPYGSLTIPLSRVSSFQMEPIRGTVAQFPNGDVKLEPLAGSPITVPLQEIQTLQRDQSRDAVTLTLADGQSYTGKLVQLPEVSIAVTTPAGPVVTVPLSRVSYLERTPPGGRLL
jgi:hypothetical protein